MYRGMGSIDAMRAGSSDRYFQSSDGEEEAVAETKLVAEGIEGRVPHRDRGHHLDEASGVSGLGPA